MNGDLFQNRWKRLPEAVIRREQAEQLRRYLRAVVLPFSAHYRELFHRLGLKAEAIRPLEDLQRLPFTTKSDLLHTPARPQRFTVFLLAPSPAALRPRPRPALTPLLRRRRRCR